MSATDIVPADTTIANVSDAAHELARCRIARDVIDEHEGAVRKWLLQRALDTKEAEGASPRYAVTDDGGRKLANVSLSEPEPKPKVTDEVSLAVWAEVQGADVRWTRECQVTDHDGLADLMENLHETGESAPLAAIQACVDVLELPALPESYPADLIAACDLHDSGALIDPATGEVVPGIEWELRSKPTLSVRVDKDARLRQTKALRQRLPKIEGGTQ